jgi:WD40 repeat protein
VGKTQTQKKTSPIFLIVVFVAVMIVMFVARMRSHNVQTITVPFNNGIVSLLTYSNFLAAVSNDNKIYVWEWSDLSKKPREFAVESGETVFAAPDTILSVKRTNPDCLFASGLDANSENKKIPLSLKSNTASLCANRDSSKIILLLLRGTDEHITYEVLEVEFNIKKVRLITTIPAEHGTIEHSAVSDDGKYVVVAGEKKEQGWVLLVDTKENQIVWQKEFPDFKKVNKGVFSKDGDIIYLRGSDSTLTLLKTSSGEIIDRLLPTDENKSSYRNQHAQTVAISSDGDLVAATVFSNIYVWETKTRKKYDIGSTGQKVFSSMTFSPDAKFIVTADMRQGGDIKVVQLPRH